MQSVELYNYDIPTSLIIVMIIIIIMTLFQEGEKYLIQVKKYYCIPTEQSSSTVGPLGLKTLYTKSMNKLPMWHSTDIGICINIYIFKINPFEKSNKSML